MGTAIFSYKMQLEDTARYAGLLLAPAEGFGLWPIFGNFWCPVVPLVIFSSNISTFERNPKNQKNPKQIQKNSKNFKKSKNLNKSKKS